MELTFKREYVMARELLVGLGESVITPKENLQMHGFGKSQVATGTHDDLHSRCMIVKDDRGKTAALLVVSFVEIEERELANRMRDVVAKAADIERKDIMLTCTHTHSGPNLTVASDSYIEYLMKQIDQSAQEAVNSLKPSTIGVSVGEQLEVGKNRRRLLYGGMHPDPQLAVIKIADLSGKLRGLIFNYGCHPATLDWRNTLYSEDWPYYAIKGIKEEVGDDAWVCFLQGAQGDINTGYDSLLSAIGAYMPVRDFPYIQYKGKQMAQSVIELLKNAEMQGSFSVDVIAKNYELPLRNSFPITMKEAEENVRIAEKNLRKIENKPEYKGSRKLDKYITELYSAKQTLALAEDFYSGDLPKKESTELQVIRIGEIVFFALPGEVFSEIALKIKEKSPYKNTFAVGVANGYYAYMPTKEEFVDGDYEVDGSKFSPETEDVFIEATLEIINNIKMQEDRF